MSLPMFPVLLQGRGQVGRYIRCQWSIRQTVGEDSSRWPQLVLHVKGVDYSPSSLGPISLTVSG